MNLFLKKKKVEYPFKTTYQNCLLVLEQHLHWSKNHQLNDCNQFLTISSLNQSKGNDNNVV